MIDVSGDGTSNQGRLVTEPAMRRSGRRDDQRARHFQPGAAATGGYLAMHTNPPGGLAQYYRENVIGGPALSWCRSTISRVSATR